MTIEDLVDRGFQLVAQGDVPGEVGASCMPINVNGSIDRGCRPFAFPVGAFRRLEKGDEAFVCVSSKNWACFRSGPEPSEATAAP